MVRVQRNKTTEQKFAMATGGTEEQRGDQRFSCCFSRFFAGSAQMPVKKSQRYIKKSVFF